MHRTASYVTATWRLSYRFGSPMPHDTTRREVGSARPARRITPGRRFPLAVVAAGLGLSLAGCQRVGVSPPVAPPSAAACPAPQLDTRGWVAVSDSAGVRYRLPAGFAQRQPGDLPYRQWTFSGELSGRVSIGFSPSREHYTTLRRVPSPPMREMNECVEDVDGRQILVQAWRTEGGRFTGGQRLDLYEMLALVPVEPMLTLFVTGGGAGPAFQRVLLAIARTVRVDAR